MRQHRTPPGALANGARSSTRRDKRTAILQAACDLFVRQGFAATSIEEIALKAGVARQTIYNQFSSKEQVFRALAGSLVDRATGSLLDPDQAGGPDLRATLVDLAIRMRSLFLEPSSLALHRQLIYEAAHFPELGREVYLAGPRRSVLQLADFLQHRLPRSLTKDDAIRAAEQFFGMMMGQSHLRALLGVDEPEPPAHIIAERTVDDFLRSWGAG